MTTSHDDDSYILIVEDDADLRGVEADVLSGEGYLVRTAADGIEALELMRDAGTPAVIILDLRMPRLNGWDFVARLRADEAWKQIPVVVVAAHYAIAREASSIGAKAWLHKPMSIDSLVSVVDRVYTGRTDEVA